MTDRVPFQFSLQSLFWLTTAWAVILGLSQWLGGPPVLRGFLAVYGIGIAMYVFLRVPTLIRRVQAVRKQHQESVRQLEAALRQRRRSEDPKEVKQNVQAP